jgi:SAM-dependent methyltransferase
MQTSIPERSNWESRYQAGDMPWEKGQAAPPLVEFTRRVPLQGHVLVPGCGTGHEVRWLASLGLRVTGLDIAPTALELAHRSTPPELPVTWVQGDFFQPPAEWIGAFDGLVEHTCFCAIPPDRRTDYARSCAQLVKPDGFFLAVFYRDPGSNEGPPFGCTLEELDGLFGESFQLVEDYVPTPAFEGREGREQVRFYQRRTGQNAS